MNLLDQHRLSFDPFRQGDRAPHLGFAMHATRGVQFPIREGGIALMRRALYPSPGTWTYCGLANLDDTTIRNWPGMLHEAGQGYQYAAVEFIGGGFISEMCEPIRIDFDGAGGIINPRLPIFPRDVEATAIDGGRFEVQFTYDPYGQGDWPKDFQVFEGPDAGNVDYNTPLVDDETGLNYVAYLSIRRSFVFTTAGYADLSSHVFGVRGRSSAAVRELNMIVTVPVVAQAAAPANAPAPLQVALTPMGRMGG